MRNCNLQKYKKTYGIFFSILFFSLLFNPSTNTPIHELDSFQLSGITKTLAETKETLDGISRFANSIKNFFTGISGIFGIDIILFLISALFFSSIFSFIGIPKGRFSFFLSVITVDLLWYTWLKSFSPGSSDYIFNIIKTNLFIIVPVLSYFIIKKFTPALFQSIIILTGKIFFRRRKILKRSEFVDYVERYNKVSSQLQLSLFNDIINGSEKKIILSKETDAKLKELDDIIKIIINDKKEK